MPLDNRGYTTLPEFDFDSQIRERMPMIQSIGDAQNQYVQAAAARRLALQRAQDQAALAGAAQEGAANSQVQLQGVSGASQGFGTFMNAISKQESGGNYGARNRDSGAMGKYQIMPGNIEGAGRGWDYEALGHDVSTAQFMSSPQIQEKIAQYKLQQYYKKYGPAGAAIAWYAGPGAAQKYASSGYASNGGEGNYPSISGYMKQILQKMGY
jgi:hypothetical protein